MELRQITAVVVRAPQTTQNLVISRCCFAEEAKESTEIHNARAQWVLRKRRPSKTKTSDLRPGLRFRTTKTKTL